ANCCFFVPRAPLYCAYAGATRERQPAKPVQTRLTIKNFVANDCEDFRLAKKISPRTASQSAAGTALCAAVRGRLAEHPAGQCEQRALIFIFVALLRRQFRPG